MNNSIKSDIDNKGKDIKSKKHDRRGKGRQKSSILQSTSSVGVEYPSRDNIGSFCCTVLPIEGALQDLLKQHYNLVGLEAGWINGVSLDTTLCFSNTLSIVTPEELIISSNPACIQLWLHLFIPQGSPSGTVSCLGCTLESILAIRLDKVIQLFSV